MIYSGKGGDGNEVALVNPLPARRSRRTITGTRKADELTGTKKADVICGLGGNDTIRGLGDNDILETGPATTESTVAPAGTASSEALARDRGIATKGDRARGVEVPVR